MHVDACKAQEMVEKTRHALTRAQNAIAVGFKLRKYSLACAHLSPSEINGTHAAVLQVSCKHTQNRLLALRNEPIHGCVARTCI